MGDGGWLVACVLKSSDGPVGKMYTAILSFVCYPIHLNFSLGFLIICGGGG
jgi:hypothetical protein